MSESRSKIAAIFELREAAERKALADKALSDDPSSEKRDELLSAQLELAEKTIAAVEVCHECGREHAPETPHSSAAKEGHS